MGVDDPLGFLFDGTDALGLGLEELPAVATLEAVSLGGLSMGFGSASSVAGLPFGPTFDHLFEVALELSAVDGHALPEGARPDADLALARQVLGEQRPFFARLRQHANARRSSCAIARRNSCSPTRAPATTPRSEAGASDARTQPMHDSHRIRCQCGGACWL